MVEVSPGVDDGNRRALTGRRLVGRRDVRVLFVPLGRIQRLVFGIRRRVRKRRSLDGPFETQPDVAYGHSDTGYVCR
ncbi:hypothetical protein [Natronomonas sp. CBA1123]|uniref:hypothetical protein n=1 Tax=Natronomonas sp. CBA1123 TaxID=2668070 RepID=UPI0018D2732B|nr:hypothetical protein [Natronomonas sp. CBA1123]